ncbi:rhomboid family intramembrane serine protease [Streptococcus cristatus]|uniref:Rhomboid protease GluP n=1 Tax=Streptococcus cristatus TaxID=45634 RepID=A0A428HA92_STRCR|nr:rhomboid family intramembrane serine protease [Streptococcus cristatus]RSJ92758.1 Rhomboid protease GluP [Streptococcus cristatus]
MKQIFDRDYPVTSILLIITSLVFALMFLFYGFQYSSTEALSYFGAVRGYTIQETPMEFWRVFAAIFIHIGLEHFVVNMLTLYFLGRQIEDIFGPWKFLLLYLMSGVMGNLFVVYFSPESLAAGASTALFGLFASVVVLRYATRNYYLQQLGQSYMSLLAVNLIISFLPGISLAGHLGGLVGGALGAVILPISGERYAFSKPQRFSALAAYLGLAAILMFLTFQRPIF